MTQFSLTTTWLIEAPLEKVWDAIYESERWPSWWPYVVHVQESVRGENGGLGNVRRYTWRTRLPYRLSFDAKTTHIERLCLLEGIVDGELQGRGRWRFYRQDDIIAIRYDWEVNVGPLWMRHLVPLLRRLMKWNHDAVMLAGGKGLARHLGGRFLGMKKDG
jgi:Polyketide cyclase / dehydrase and lipid transport